jgi:hypothetical protein
MHVGEAYRVEGLESSPSRSQLFGRERRQRVGWWDVGSDDLTSGALEVPWLAKEE